MLKKTTPDYILLAKTIHGDKFDYSLVDYKGSHTNIIVICPFHGSFEVKAHAHLKYDCKKCSDTRSASSRRMSLSAFKEKANIVHGNKYRYDVTSSFQNQHEFIKICCPDHGVFKQPVNDHLKGHGCRQCANLLISISSTKSMSEKKLTNEDFINRATNVHGDKYCYSLTSFSGFLKNVKIICKEHGDFDQLPNNHLSGNGCPICSYPSRGRSKIPFDELVTKASEVHGDRYLYEESIIPQSIRVFCKDHGWFEQLYYVHVRGCGCPRCGMKKTIKQHAWLDEMGIGDNNREVSVNISGKKYVLDALQDGIAYEFWGDFWHGNPKKFNPLSINNVTKTTFGELYEATNRKRTAIVTAGYKLIEVWESDWDRIVNKNVKK